MSRRVHLASRLLLLAAVATSACIEGTAVPSRAVRATSAPLASTVAASVVTGLAAKFHEDLAYFAGTMPKMHLNLFHSTSRSSWYAAIAALDAKLDRLAPAEFEVELLRLVAMSHDGHTQLQMPYAGTAIVPAFREFPVTLYRYSDGVFVQQAAPEVGRLAGARLITIDDTPIDAALELVTPLIDRDSDAMLGWYQARYLVVAEIDEAVGITHAVDHARFRFEKDGATETVDLVVRSIGSHTGWVDARTATSRPTPLYLRDPGNAYWASRIGDEALYVQWNAVRPKPLPEESIDGFFARVLQDLDVHPVRKLIIDVRFNQGGERYYAGPVVDMIESRPALNRAGALFVITGRRTFSSGVVFCALMEKRTRVTFVGEPASSRPNQYSSIARFTLPNTALVIGASTRYEQDADPTDERPWIAPHIAVSLTSGAYAQNIDPELDAILDRHP